MTVRAKGESGAGGVATERDGRPKADRARIHVLAAVSLANLLLLRLWAGVLDPATSYFLDAPRPWQGHAATVLVFLALAAAGIAVAAAAPASSGRTRRTIEIAFFGVLALAVFGMREQIADFAGAPVRTFLRQEGPIGFIAMVLAVALFAAAFAPDRIRTRVRRWAVTVLLVFSPFVLVTAGQTAIAAVRAANGTSALHVAARPAAPRTAAREGAARVVVVILDEWDQFLSFEERTRGVELPAIDALAAEAVHFTRAEAPALVTELVLPSLLTGRRVVDTSDLGSNDRRLRFADGTVAPFSATPTFLTHVRDSGRNAALTGWYHPYCRVLGDVLVECSSRGIRREFAGLPLARAAARQAQVFLEGQPQARKLLRAAGARPTRLTTREWQEESWKKIHEHALALVADPTIDVVVAHYPVPHPPWLGGEGYDGNLRLADRSVSELVTAMKEAGIWDRSAMVLLSDHPKRTAGLVPLPSARLAPGQPRPVPFLVRLPGGNEPVVDPRPLSTLVLHDLVLELAEGTLQSSGDVDTWLLERDAYSMAPTE